MIEIVTIFEGIIAIIVGIALLASPSLVIQLLGIFVILVGGIVVSKGFIKKFRD
jgi:uncharacterized membrane protein HdeD (DUF308 family)